MADISEILRAGVEHQIAGRFGEAEEMYRRVLQIHPRHAGAFHLLGLIAFQVGKVDVALHCLREAIRIDAFNPMFPADQAEIYRSLGRIPEALASWEKSLDLNPEIADSQNFYGTLLSSLGRRDEAIACFREAIRLNPRHPEAHGHLGNALEAEGQFAAAQEAFGQAIQLTPEQAVGYIGLGKCLSGLSDWQSALACYEKAYELHPDLAEAQYLAALARLAQGDFAAGWRDFEWRLRCPSPGRRTYALPAWNGATLHGHRVLIHAEPGLSDTLQFVRYVPFVTERGATVWLDAPAELAPLLAASGFENLLAADQPDPSCHLQAPLLSLPRILSPKLDTIPAEVPYLRAKADLVEHWQRPLAELGGFKVGIVWQGDPARVHSDLRSIPLAAFQPLAEVPGIRLVSLQKKDGLEQLAGAAEALELVILGDDFDESHGAFMDTAAVMAHLDLVIACDTAVAHLAGALGMPVWLALATASDWRWMQDRQDSPWYPTMRLFRQTTAGDWPEVMRRMAAELSKLVTTRS